MLALMELGINPAIAKDLDGVEDSFFREAALIKEKQKSEFMLQISTAFYYALTSQKNHDPYKKKKKKQAFNGAGIFEEWQTKLTNVVNRVNKHISKYKPFTVFDWLDIRRYGLGILQKSTKKKVIRKMDGQNIVSFEEE